MKKENLNKFHRILIAFYLDASINDRYLNQLSEMAIENQASVYCLNIYDGNDLSKHDKKIAQRIKSFFLKSSFIQLFIPKSESESNIKKYVNDNKIDLVALLKPSKIESDRIEDYFHFVEPSQL